MLAIIIINWNTKDLLKRCIENLNGISIKVPFEIIVVDNASTDGSREFLTSRFMGRKILNTSNIGFGAACNLAAGEFTAKAYLFLNTDAFPEKGCVEKLYDIIIASNEISLASPQLVNKNGSLQRTFSRFPVYVTDRMSGKFTFIPLYYEKKKMNVFPETIQETDAVTGACMMVNGSIFEKMGGFDEDFFFFLEETDFCLRCRKQGYRIIVIKDARCIHLKGKSTKNDLLKYRKIFLTSQLLFLKKHLPEFLYYPIRRKMIIRFYRKAAVYSFLNMITFFVLPKLRFKSKLYKSFISDKGWKKTDKLFTGVFKGQDFFVKVKSDFGYRFIRKDLKDCQENFTSSAEILKKEAEIIKDTSFSLTSVVIAGGIPVNIKLYRNKRRIPFLPPIAERAFYGAFVLKSLKIPIPEILGYSVKARSKELGRLFTLHDKKLKVLNFIFDEIRKKCGNNLLLYKEMKKKIFDSIAEVFRKLYSSRVIHRDLKASNILVKIDWSDTKTPFSINLIDFENVVIDPPLFERCILKGLAQLNKSFPDLSIISLKERIYFFKKCMNIDKLDRKAKKRIKRINLMTKKMFKKKNLKFYYSVR
ncbi:MAG: glycosyltransferase [Candidatus Aureabacteria bacterium]|nr:glycosyltransferase [Candidatus Auribacterota bacterium]